MSSGQEFLAKVRGWREAVERGEREAFVEVATAVRDSVVDGSPVTGAPGQPVDEGNLKGSWQLTFPAQDKALVATNAAYAPAVEEGQQAPYTTSAGTPVAPAPMTLRSATGGFHSVKLTQAGWQALVDDVVRRHFR